MPSLNWIHSLERTGPNELQQVSYEPEKQLISYGNKLIRCHICKRWVRESDYIKYCRQGMCEFSAEVELEDLKPMKVGDFKCNSCGNTSVNSDKCKFC